jgi:hypothetical protein
MNPVDFLYMSKASCTSTCNRGIEEHIPYPPGRGIGAREVHPSPPDLSWASTDGATATLIRYLVPAREPPLGEGTVELCGKRDEVG